MPTAMPTAMAVVRSGGASCIRQLARREEDEEKKEEGEKEKNEEEQEKQPLIKSNNPHLASREKNNSKHLLAHQWIRSAIRASQQLMHLPCTVLSSKLLP